ncbi:gamma-glutamylcyclotransferase [Nocardia sp. NBC_01503]|uniref:gamma-glutamylcyclotransferase family protein n=1 Tax=Nocardia sp. NBC_01503 TaxID=2975997 RepID=UPI002E7C0AC6|nr:gamma-glutamylcyclotransferase family protein [Nocardia sp. NBC_01503]WTL29961.1 gamma-glutamylcyclotransferase [Nocardia sp. NBC_01503]
MSSRPWARRLPAGDAPLFVYGTLRFPEILHELIGGTTHLLPAELPRRRVAVLPGKVYPGLVYADSGAAQGFLLTGLTRTQWCVLDEFEDDEYDLAPVLVHAGERAIYAWTYAWTADVDAADWSAADFAATHLTNYVEQCRRLTPGIAPGTVRIP